MTTWTGTPVVPERMAEHSACKASPPWPEVFALLSTTDLYRSVFGVRRLQEMTLEDVAAFATRYGLELD